MDNDFMDDELDPLDIVKAKEQFEIDMELSVIAAYDIVYKAGYKGFKGEECFRWEPYPNKEHLYSKKITRAVKIYITSFSQGWGGFH